MPKTQLRLYDWVHHYEKMLYDNALLIRAYLHAWQVTKEPAYKRIVEETLDFVAREMTHGQGGFYSSLDADSEGEEGKFYIWSLAEIRDVLKDDSEFFEAAYGITIKGNWEGKTILQRVLDDASLTARALRIYPGTDDKILTAWNSLMLAAVAESACVLDRKDYLLLATRNANFILSKLRPNGRLRRSWRNGKVTNAVFLEDYSALILGLLELYQTDFDNKWFVAAKELADEMIEKFNDPEGGFFDTPSDGESLLIRPKDIQDNATPCGNSLACEALLKLAAFTDEGKYRDIAEKSSTLITDFVLRYPLGFARWLSVAENARGNMKQVAVLGDAGEEISERMIKLIRAEYRPGLVTAASSLPIMKDSPTLLKDRPMMKNKTTAYVCEEFICKQPTNDIQILIEQLKS